MFISSEISMGPPLVPTGKSIQTSSQNVGNILNCQKKKKKKKKNAKILNLKY